MLEGLNAFYLILENFFLFHPRDYYKLSFIVTFNDTFGNLWKLWRVYAQWRMLYKLEYDQVHKSWHNPLFNQHIVLTFFMRLVANALECSFILSLAESFNLISNVCSTLRSWCRVSLTYVRSIDDDSEISVLKSFHVLYFYIWLSCAP